MAIVLPASAARDRVSSISKVSDMRIYAVKKLKKIRVCLFSG